MQEPHPHQGLKKCLLYLISVIGMGSAETLHVFSVSTLKVGGSRELYCRDEVGRGKEGENERERERGREREKREKHKASKRTFHKPGQPQPQQLSQNPEKNNPNK